LALNGQTGILSSKDQWQIMIIDDLRTRCIRYDGYIRLWRSITFIIIFLHERNIFGWWRSALNLLNN
jgi:hypothetical protein